MGELKKALYSANKWQRNEEVYVSSEDEDDDEDEDEPNAAGKKEDEVTVEISNMVVSLRLKKP